MSKPFDSTLKQLLADFAIDWISWLAFLRCRGMKESTTYQAILREGRQEGLLAARQDDLVDLLRERFGVVPDELEQEIRSSTDLTRLRAAIRRAVQVATLSEFTL